jgi:formylglycine-generating enzyme required for sulfatase activity
MALEHEGFHVEVPHLILNSYSTNCHLQTLLYMLIQRAGTGALPPPGFTVPPWTLLSQQWDAHPPPLTATVVLGPAEVVLGHNDSEADDIVNVSVDHEFGWDNESPARGVLIGGFKVEWRPVSNDEFWAFLKTGGAVGLPKSWVEEQGEIKVSRR